MYSSSNPEKTIDEAALKANMKQYQDHGAHVLALTAYRPNDIRSDGQMIEATAEVKK